MIDDGNPSPPRGVRTMAVVRWILVAVMGVIAVGAVLAYFGAPLREPGGAGATIYYCPMHPQIQQDHPGECPICSMTLVPKPPGAVKASATMQPAADAGPATPGPRVPKYYCPMHPHITSDDPNATCPLCGGMKLVPNPAATARAAASPSAAAAAPVPGLAPVDIPLDRVQKIGVRTARVARQPLAAGLRTVGVVEADERRLASISPRFSGWIETLAVSETGQRVRRGQALATIYSPDVLQAQQELLTALGWAGGAPPPAAGQHHTDPGGLQGMAADARRRLELLGISAQEIDAIIASRRVQRAIAIRSPVEGHVIAKNAVVGMTVSPGAPLFQVADLSSVWVVADVYESDVKRITVGRPARFEVSAYPGESFAGKVKFVYPTLDPSARTLRLRLEIRNRPGPAGLKLLPGMHGNVMLDLPASSGLVVPSEALVDTGDLQYVFVARAGGRFEPRRVRVGARFDDRVEITEGLGEGETVVTTANFLIDSESRLQAAIGGQGSAPAASDAGAR